MAVVAASLNTQTNIDIVMFSARRRFSRDQEREADILGLGYLGRGPYRPQVAAEVWNRRMDEVDAIATGRGMNSSGTTGHRSSPLIRPTWNAPPT